MAVELEGPGQIEQSDVALVKKITATMALEEEPATLDRSTISVGNGIGFSIPSDFTAYKQDDPLITTAHMRSRQSDSSQSITAMPIMLLPKDGGTTLQTMLSLYEDDLFETGQAKQDDSGAWRIDADPRLQKVLPVRAYAMSKDGIGMLAIFRGGDGDAWIEPAWKSIQQSLSFPDEWRVNEMGQGRRGSGQTHRRCGADQISAGQFG